MKIKGVLRYFTFNNIGKHFKWYLIKLIAITYNSYLYEYHVNEVLKQNVIFEFWTQNGPKCPKNHKMILKMNFKIQQTFLILI